MPHRSVWLTRDLPAVKEQQGEWWLLLLGRYSQATDVAGTQKREGRLTPDIIHMLKTSFFHVCKHTIFTDLVLQFRASSLNILMSKCDETVISYVP